MLNREDCNYLNERIRKITDALYKVTDFLLDKEPLKWMLRETGLGILMNIISLEKEKSAPKKVVALRESLSSLNRIVFALELAGSSGFISEINFEILKKEYDKIKNMLEAINIKKDDSLLFPEELLLETIKDNPIKDIDKGHLVSNKDENLEVKLPSENLTSKFKSSRAKQIINFVKKNGWSTVKEISGNFPDLNQKTIQRELADMLKSRTLKKQGDKRWRKYSLIKQKSA